LWQTTDAKWWQKLTLHLARWAKKNDRFLDNISVISWGSFYWWGKQEYSQKTKTNDPPQVTDKLYHIMLYLSWMSVLLVEETGVTGENHWPVTSRLQALSHNVVSSTHRRITICTILWVKFKHFYSFIIWPCSHNISKWTPSWTVDRTFMMFVLFIDTCGIFPSDFLLNRAVRTVCLWLYCRS
jgi:hypothetical protein